MVSDRPQAIGKMPDRVDLGNAMQSVLTILTHHLSQLFTEA
jgi:hypothetical protein